MMVLIRPHRATSVQDVYLEAESAGVPKDEVIVIGKRTKVAVGGSC